MAELTSGMERGLRSNQVLRLACVGLLAALTVALMGCGESAFTKPYGYVVPDADPVRPDGSPVVMPPNAPSTMNGHWADYGGHAGIDVFGPVGLPVLAVAAGEVTYSHFEPLYGHTVYINHGLDPQGNDFQTRYVHLDDRQVEVGQRVVRGQRLGSLGRTGMLAGGIPHLHFEVQTRAPERWEIHEPQNPHAFWADGIGVVTCFDINARYNDEVLHATYPVPCRDVPWQ